MHNILGTTVLFPSLFFKPNKPMKISSLKQLHSCDRIHIICRRYEGYVGLMLVLVSKFFTPRGVR